MSKNYKMALERYNSLIERSFKKNLKYFFFNSILLNKNLTFDNIEAELLDFYNSPKESILWHYHRFSALYLKDDLNLVFINVDDENNRIQGYDYKLNAKVILEKIEKYLSQYHIPKSGNLLFEKYKDIFKKKLNFDEFKKFHKEDEHDRKCYYCGITEKNIQELLSEYKINKDFMFYPRGEHMEIDRKNPLDDYGEKTIALCCYWCNNAKTDEFTANEFLTIAKGIQSIWEYRLSQPEKPVKLKPGYLD